MLSSLLNLAVAWIFYLHTLLILTDHSSGPMPGMWAGFDCICLEVLVSFGIPLWWFLFGLKPLLLYYRGGAVRFLFLW